jgi:hypothetical protein
MPEERRPVRTRFWWECIAAALTGALFILTLVWHNWLEAFGIDPDHGNGSAEWFIVSALFLVSVTFAIVARFEWRRSAIASA